MTNEKAALLEAKVEKLEDMIKSYRPHCELIDLLPVGTILGWFSSELPSTKWRQCDGKYGTPNLNDRYPIGTTNGEIGEEIGRPKHNHHVKGRTDIGRREKWVKKRGFRKDSGEHKCQTHGFDVESDPTEWIPPSTRIKYIMKIE